MVSQEATAVFHVKVDDSLSKLEHTGKKKTDQLMTSKAESTTLANLFDRIMWQKQLLYVHKNRYTLLGQLIDHTTQPHVSRW